MLVAEKNYLNDYEQYNIDYKRINNKNNKRNVAKTKKKHLPDVSRTFFCIGLLFSIGFFIMVRSVAITELANTIDKQKSQISDLEKNNSQLKTNLFVDLNEVENVAKNKLGMVRPYDYQTVYVNLGDEGKQSNQIASKQKFDIAQKINNIFNYLY